MLLRRVSPSVLLLTSAAALGLAFGCTDGDPTPALAGIVAATRIPRRFAGAMSLAGIHTIAFHLGGRMCGRREHCAAGKH